MRTAKTLIKVNSISVLYKRMKKEDKNSGGQLNMALSCTHDWLSFYNGHTKYFFNVLENWQAL